MVTGFCSVLSVDRTVCSALPFSNHPQLYWLYYRHSSSSFNKTSNDSPVPGTPTQAFNVFPKPETLYLVVLFRLCSLSEWQSLSLAGHHVSFSPHVCFSHWLIFTLATGIWRNEIWPEFPLFSLSPSSSHADPFFPSALCWEMRARPLRGPQHLSVWTRLGRSRLLQR